METHRATKYGQLQNEDSYNQPPPPPLYATDMVTPTAVVIHNPGMATVTVATAPVRWSWCHLVTAVFSIWCCSCFGVIATVSSILAYVDHKGKEFQRSRTKRNMSLGFSIAAIVIGSIIGSIIGIIFIVAYAETNQMLIRIDQNQGKQLVASKALAEIEQITTYYNEY